jgi:hypothetical protein
MTISNDELVAKGRAVIAGLEASVLAAETRAAAAELRAERLGKPSGPQATGVFVDGIRQHRATAAVVKSGLNPASFGGRLADGLALEKSRVAESLAKSRAETLAESAAAANSHEPTGAEIIAEQTRQRGARGGARWGG